MEQYNHVSAGGYVQLPIVEKNVTTELSADFTLPDYQPEIKRLLCVKASVLPPSRYVGSNEAELSGGIDYYVLYTGRDDRLYCAPLSSEYKITVPLEAFELTGYTDKTAASETVPEQVSGRVTSPRKLNIKCRLRSHVKIYGEMMIEDGFEKNGEEMQVLVGESRVTRCLQGVGEKLSLTDEMLCDNREGEMRVIMAEGKVLMSEASSLQGGVNCRGDLYLKLLLCREEGGLPYTALRKLPFSTTVPMEGVTSSDSCYAKATVCELNITVEEGRILIDIGMIPEAEAMHKENIAYVKDMYSTAHQTTGRYQSCKLPTGGNCFSGNFTLSESKSLAELGFNEGCRVIDVAGVVLPEEHRVEGDRCMVTGKVKMSLLCEQNGELSVQEAETPFRYEVAVKEAENACGAAEVISASARCDGERVGIDAEIGFSGSAIGQSDAEILAGLDFGGEYTREKGEITVCYPADSDSLWSVAKRYGRPVGSLAQYNGIALDGKHDLPESLEGMHYLIV